MGGDASLWQGMWTPERKAEITSLLRHAFGLDSQMPSMVAYYYREKYPVLYEYVIGCSAAEQHNAKEGTSFKVVSVSVTEEV